MIKFQFKMKIKINIIKIKYNKWHQKVVNIKIILNSKTFSNIFSLKLKILKLLITILKKLLT